MSKNKKETSLCRLLMDYYKDLGYKVGTGNIYGKDVDFVAIKDNEHIGVETKLKPNAKVFCQALKRKDAFNYMYLCYINNRSNNKGRHNDKITLLRHACKDVGIGIFEAEGNILRIKLEAQKIEKPMFRNRLSFMENVQGGNPTGKEMTPFKQELLDVYELILQQGRLTVNEIVEELNDKIYQGNKKQAVRSIVCNHFYNLFERDGKYRYFPNNRSRTIEGVKRIILNKKERK